jgi:ribosomal protein L7Ae-like RNA K-turn-binding protein
VDEFLQLLGLANRAGKVITGEDHIISHIRNNKVKLVIVASDASENTKKKYEDKCKYYQVSLVEYSTTVELSHAISKMNRVAVGVIDAGFTKGLLAKLTKKE